MVAGEHNPAFVVMGESTTVRILEVNGAPTGAGRFNAGSVTIKPGPIRAAVRLWGHPPGRWPWGAIAFVCVEFDTKAGKTYLLSGSVTGDGYRLFVHDKSLVNESPVLEVPVEFDQKLPATGCS